MAMIKQILRDVLINKNAIMFQTTMRAKHSVRLQSFHTGLACKQDKYSPSDTKKVLSFYDNINSILNEINSSDDSYDHTQYFRNSQDVQDQSQDHNQSQSDQAIENLNVLNEVIDEQHVDVKKAAENFLDTYGIYSQLCNAGFTDSQSKIILSLLTEELNSQVHYLSKNFSPQQDLENDTYLFEAAQSELSVEINGYRDSNLSDLMNSSIFLKRLFNSLEDSLNIQYQLIDNSMKLEIDQFKHENNLTNKKLNIRNHDLNNRIGTELMSGIKSEIESLRWAITRAGVLALLSMVFSILVCFNVSQRSASKEETEMAADKQIDTQLRRAHLPAETVHNEYEADWEEDQEVS
ncbi:hypothetical protein KP2612_001061 [Komagataella phaffii]|uniref:Uncharacterized protein n=2 Tax=Komagataella phaffii TaxID=460519 RepID=C4QXT9_KOMPG|nr:uncharacterized protein PAS_chr1-4_0227 [Komagataella phaffii GS115]AOA61094.1 GQ67_01948T0 [Komagataella phaffii]AOA65625.1 GQ68_01963T0 [Komagataella phaffii GS115]CAY68062.1 hypothetical protein PAS_chr1-4_0227 [Komagataella phaffii GS115]